MYQVLMYMYLMNVNKGVLLYENTNDKRLLAVPVEMTEENTMIVESAFEWMRKVWEAHLNGLMPARPWKQTSPNCADCPLFNECWGENSPPEDIKIKSMQVHNW
jgi:CRISPR/Cas system-associated exonuclease Cas4 (RecB family)